MTFPTTLAPGAAFDPNDARPADGPGLEPTRRARHSDTPTTEPPNRPDSLETCLAEAAARTPPSSPLEFVGSATGNRKNEAPAMRAPCACSLDAPITEHALEYR